MRAVIEEALALDPGDHDVRAYLAWALATAPVATVRDGARAVTLAERALEAGETADRLDTLGAALAEAGRHQDAERAVQRALGLLPPDAVELRAEY